LCYDGIIGEDFETIPFQKNLQPRQQTKLGGVIMRKLNKPAGVVVLAIMCLVLTPLAPRYEAVMAAPMPMDCDAFISGGSQGNALDCIDAVIFLYAAELPWDGTWDLGGYGYWP